MEPDVQLTPSDFLQFRGLSINENALLTLKNNGADVCFKIKTSSPKIFLVKPISAVIRENSEFTVQVCFLGPLEASEKVHKFLIQMLTCQDLNLADWRSKEVREVKISTRFIIEKGEKNSEVKEEISMKESIYGDAEESREESLLLEDQKKNMTSRNSELTGDIDKLQAEIDKAMHKLKFSKDIDIMVSEAIGKYGIMHLVVMFFIGVLFGYYMLG